MKTFDKKGEIVKGQVTGTLYAIFRNFSHQRNCSHFYPFSLCALTQDGKLEKIFERGAYGIEREFIQKKECYQKLDLIEEDERYKRDQGLLEKRND